MALSLITYFLNSGQIFLSEMRDWRQHFINGTKGMKKTSIDVLDYVEALLKETFENNTEKVNNNPLAPWLVNTVASIGIENIDSNQRKQLLTILSWAKETNSIGNIPKMNFQQAYDFATESLEKIKRKKEQSSTNQPEINQQDIPPLEDELKGKIERIATLPDGSGRMWVKVLDPNWFKEICKAKRTKGVECQATTKGVFAKAPYESYTLIGPPKGKSNGDISTIASISINTRNNSIEELKQEGNQHPGAQATSGGWKDIGDRVVDFICYSPIMKSKVDKFTSGGFEEGRAYGGINTLLYWMKHKQELFNKIMKSRPDIFTNTQDLIRKHHPLGLKWFELSGVDINDMATNNPIDFLNNIEYFYSIYGNKIKSAIDKINIESTLKSKPESILENLPLLVEFISPDELSKIFSIIPFDDYLNANITSFKSLLRKLSSLPQYKDMLGDIIGNHGPAVISAFGNKGVGLQNFLRFVSAPKLEKHLDAIRNPITGEYEGTRLEIETDPTTGRREEKSVKITVPDDLKILPQRERRRFIIKNKEYIKSFFIGDEKKKEIEYLRFLFMESNVQDVERTLKPEKQEFINYYNTKFKEKQSKFPGIIEFYAVINRNKPNYIQNHGEKSYFPMTIEDLKDKNNMKEIILYYWSKSEEESGIKKKYEAIGDYIKTLQLSGEPEDEMIKFYKDNFAPPKITQIPQSIDYVTFAKTLEKFVDDRKKIVEFIKTLKNEMEKSGISGIGYYKQLIQDFTDKIYQVKIGDMVQYLGNNREGIYLTKGMKYHVVGIDSETGLINSMINVIDDTKKESWHHSRDFEIKLVTPDDTLMEQKLRILIREELNKNFFNNTMTMDQNKKPAINYSAVVLDDKSREKLLTKFHIPEGWEKICRHMIINIGNIKPELEHYLGLKVGINVEAIGISDKAMAIKISGFPTEDTTPHITLAINTTEGGKPADSNLITNWQAINHPFRITGIVTEVPFKI